MIPKPIYEALPFLYAMVGVAAVLNLDVAPARFCGLLLLLAAYLIFNMRKEYRRGSS